MIVPGRPAALSADLASLVPGRRLDDHSQIMLCYQDGSRGLLWASQAFAGFWNPLAFSHRRRDREPRLVPGGSRVPGHRQLDGAQRTLRRGEPEVAELAPPRRAMVGHPEGYVEAFANLYREIADAIMARRQGRGARAPAAGALFPTVEDGVEGVAFIDAALASAQDDGRWTELSRPAII